jgi:hypothetical protein
MFPADRLPLPVYIAYDCRGRRAVKSFPNGLGREARAFYSVKFKAGKHPKVLKVADEPDLFDAAATTSLADYPTYAEQFRGRRVAVLPLSLLTDAGRAAYDTLALRIGYRPEFRGVRADGITLKWRVAKIMSVAVWEVAADLLREQGYIVAVRPGRSQDPRVTAIKVDIQG